jgi:sarcosine oxidase gamma subunit
VPVCAVEGRPELAEDMRVVLSVAVPVGKGSESVAVTGPALLIEEAESDDVWPISDPVTLEEVGTAVDMSSEVTVVESKGPEARAVVATAALETEAVPSSETTMVDEAVCSAGVCSTETVPEELAPTKPAVDGAVDWLVSTGPMVATEVAVLK